ncbi:hypothetical protein CHARACLAT_009955 [Characodon lateralis]|uniref:Uncharacterized protein n=1 Tax=Characodon lateralis TaxID=208331 RepID=A0ABU7DZ87_9TELE|nr:hypothetical protein [Characodon lateralis]
MHACCKCFRKAGGKVVSGSEDGFNPFGKPLHLSVNSSVFGGILISMVQQRDVILLEKVLCQTGIVNHIVVLLKDPVNTSYTKSTVTSSHTKPGFDLAVHCFITIWLQSASGRALIWVKHQPVTSWKSHSSAVLPRSKTENANT